MRLLVISFMALLGLSLAQNSCATFSCAASNDRESNVCAILVGKGYSLKKCESETTQRCDFQYGFPQSSCVDIITTPASLLPGEPCVYSAYCMSGSCSNRTCAGRVQGEICIKHEECNIGLHCSGRGKCEPLLNSGDACGKGIGECKNELACASGKCVPIGSLDDQTPSDNELACKSLFISVDATGILKCHAPPKSASGDKPSQCQYGSLCEYQFDGSSEKLQMACKCGVNPAGNSFCHPGIGNLKNDLNKVISYFPYLI